MLYLFYYLFTIYLKVAMIKLERPRLWKLDNSMRKACNIVCFPLIYIFFEVMLMSRIDGIRSCLEDYILLFLFDYVSIFSIVMLGSFRSEGLVLVIYHCLILYTLISFFLFTLEFD